MLRLLILSFLFFFAYSGFASQSSSLYQVDVIVFTHQDLSAEHIDNPSEALVPPDAHHAILLQPNTNDKKIPYHILPSSMSQLQREYWTLSHQGAYQVIFSYTWLQPGGNQSRIALPRTNNTDWQVEGSLRIRKSNYYQLDTALLFSTPQSTHPAFMFAQKQRLKAGAIYYLDHPQAGMLIKIHEIT